MQGAAAADLHARMSDYALSRYGEFSWYKDGPGDAPCAREARGLAAAEGLLLEDGLVLTVGAESRVA
eukprot:13136675-Alexandrium_andersonii.AAC.1